MTKRVSGHSYEWKEPGKLSFAEFNVLVRQQIVEVIQIQEHVQRAYDLFSSRGGIGPGECDYLLTFLQKLSTSVCTFDGLFKEPTGLPSVITTLYYPLVAELGASEKLIKRTIQSTHSFSSPGQVASNIGVKLHCTIIRNLEELLEACKEIKILSQSMLDQARFQVLHQI